MDIKQRNPFPILHLTINNVPTPEVNDGSSVEFFDKQFWRHSGLAAMIENEYCDVEEKNMFDNLYNERNSSYGHFLKMTVVPPRFPSEFLDQVLPFLSLSYLMLCLLTLFFIPCRLSGIVVLHRATDSRSSNSPIERNASYILLFNTVSMCPSASGAALLLLIQGDLSLILLTLRIKKKGKENKRRRRKRKGNLTRRERFMTR